MVANYRVPAELTAIDSSDDGSSIVLGTVDGCLTCLTVADPKVTQMAGYVTRLPSRFVHRAGSVHGVETRLEGEGHGVSYPAE